MLSKIKQMNIDEFNGCLNHLQPIIGKAGGRYFHSGVYGKYTNRDLIKKLHELIVDNHGFINKNTNVEQKKLVYAFKKIKSLNQTVDDQLNRAGLIRRILTTVKSFFGNIFHGKTHGLIAKIDLIIRSYKPSQSFATVSLENLKEEGKLSQSHLFAGPLGGIYTDNFYEALNAGQPIQIHQYDIAKRSAEWSQVRSNYEDFCCKLKANKTSPNYTYIIPKQIHLVWVGPSKPTADVMKVKDSWAQHHPEWQVNLWGNEEVEEIINEYGQMFPAVKEAWNKAEKWAEKADIARYCILHKVGGIYADSDLPCYGKVDDLHCYADFYVAMEQNDHGSNIIYTGNALIGSKPGHGVLEYCLQNMKPKAACEDAWAIIGRTGPGLLTDAVYKELRKDIRCKTHETLVLPPSYFYPLHSGLKEVARNNPDIVDNSLQPWSKGVHLWNLSWG